jgi:hypothetical protein
MKVIKKMTNDTKSDVSNEAFEERNNINTAASSSTEISLMFMTLVNTFQKALREKHS